MSHPQFFTTSYVTLWMHNAMKFYYNMFAIEIAMHTVCMNINVDLVLQSQFNRIL